MFPVEAFDASSKWDTDQCFLHNNSTAYVILQDMRSYVSEEIAVGTL
jgi:hypothetical protein